MTSTTTTQAMTDVLYQVLESIFDTETITEGFGMDITTTEGKIVLPTHVSLIGLGKLSEDIRKRLRSKFKGNTVTLIVSA